MKPDLFEAPDYYNLDDLLTDEHKLIRDSAREWVKKSVSPIIEEYAQKAEFPNHLIKELADLGAYGPYIPEEYGGPGLDQISYGLIMQEIERGDWLIQESSDSIFKSSPKDLWNELIHMFGLDNYGFVGTSGIS